MDLSDIGVKAERYTVDGTDYIVTRGTGEVSFDLGVAGFAYDADDVDRLEGVSDYAGFCNEISPEEDRDLAIALAARDDIRLCRSGSCMPILTNDEYELVRAAVAALS